jgi:hypothetical protein
VLILSWPGSARATLRQAQEALLRAGDIVKCTHSLNRGALRGADVQATLAGALVALGPVGL